MIPNDEKGRRSTDEVVTVAAVSSSQAGKTVVASTPDHLPNNLITYVSPLAAILIRAGKAFFDTLLGVAGVQQTGIMPQLSTQDFLHNLQLAIGIAVMAAVVSIIRNAASLLTTLEQKFPLTQA